MTAQGAAFFDLDRTVMAGASTWYFGGAALRHGAYSVRALAGDAWKAAVFLHRGSTDAGADAICAQILSAVRGTRRIDMDDLVPDVLGPILGRVYPEAYARILEHERSGTPTYLCSAAPYEILLPVARALSMTGGVLGTVAAVDDGGVYTGELARPFCYGDGKRIAMLAEVQAQGFALPDCYAYSDSVSDLPMLETVGYPVVVNPDRELRLIARERHWDELLVTRPRGPWRRRSLGAGALVLGSFAIGRATKRDARNARVS